MDPEPVKMTIRCGIMSHKKEKRRGGKKKCAKYH
jgi:hypothetical protein